MQLTKYNPQRELHKMEKDMEKFWDKGWSIPALIADTLAVDMYEEDGKLNVELCLPNFKKDEISLKTDDNVLEVSAEHSEEEDKTTKRRYLLRESTSQYFRRVSLPEGADTSKIDANFSEGKLTVTMPIEPKKSPQNVTIK